MGLRTYLQLWEKFDKLKIENGELRMKKIFLGILIYFAGQISAQSVFVDEMICSQQADISISQISTLNPIELDYTGLISESFSILHSQFSIDSVQFETQFSQSRKDPIIAWLISFPVGFLGLHRVYLGTDVKTVLLYIVTAGGFLGIVPMVDWILLLKGIQTGDISKYVGNRKFLMWL